MTDSIIRTKTMEPIQRGLQNLTIQAQAIDSNITKNPEISGIHIPLATELMAAGKVIMAAAEAEQAITQINHTCTTQHYYCAAFNLERVLKEYYGINFASPKPGMFGDTPPQKITFPLSHDETATITIGQFKLPDMNVETSMTVDDKNVPRLRISVSLRNVDEHKAAHMFSLLERMPNPWQGKTLIFDEGREPRMVEIKQSTMSVDQIALNPLEEKGMDLFIQQIRHHETLRSRDILFNRGLLLAGPWGTGKTLAAAIFMAEAEKAGITVLHERSWSRLKQTISLARSMSPALVFCEDIDLMQERDFINCLDDASEKGSEVSIVVTTNHPERLAEALTRKGRLDMYIGYQLPEREARRKILAINGCEKWSEELGDVTEGMTGSDLAEIGKRAMTYSIPSGEPITADQLVSAAVTMTSPPKRVTETDLFPLFMQEIVDKFIHPTLVKWLSQNADNIEAVYNKAEMIDNTVDSIQDKLQSTYELVDRVDDKVETLVE